jgi:serine/threonine protein kinase
MQAKEQCVSAPSLVEAVFLAALEKNSPEERVAFLDAACKDDADLRRRVERLLEAHPRAGSFLDGPARPASFPSVGEETAAYVPTGEHVGALIAGRYKLVEEIGEGGMGSVWVAQQTEPVKRAVAVKLIKAGMDSKAVLARFEAERQALALMEHPNIARVLDGGATPDGRPFFVMELVKGVPITQFCDARRLTPRQRLELFVPVCQAIQHAHQKGVIHRDIKPSNVLIALYDDRPVPKVIDFGIAKAAGQTLTDKTLMTGFGSVVGTPEYMSPEQASLNNLDIDTRSDVYSLGVLLYELLAGSPPFHSDELKKAGLLEMLRVVREVEPLRPSTKLSTAHKLPSISADRGTEPHKLAGLLRNELDWIVMKALEKDRSRRYETVNGLAADVQRYLTGEAVQAHPPSAAYRLRKFARRHRVALTTFAAFAGLLIAAVALSSWLAVKANRAEATAEAKRREAEANAKEAQTNAKEARENLEWSEANSRALSETSEQLFATVIDAEIRGVGLKLDLDLAELRSDPKVGLLRLAHPLKHTTRPVPLFGPNSHGTAQGSFDEQPKFIELREFVTRAVLATGQRFAPLLPPVTHDGHRVVQADVSPDGRTLLTRGDDFTARLWDTRTARPIAVLRMGDERVVNCGFSPDGLNVFTDDQTSVARVWELPSGRFRAAIESRPNRYDVSNTWRFGATERDACQITGSRLLTKRLVARKSADGSANSVSWEGPVELWDTATSRPIVRLDTPQRNVRTFQFLNGGRWITALEGSSTVLVFSAESGKEIARLDHETKDVVDVVASPTGRRIATVFGTALPRHIRIWNTDTWNADSATTNAYGGGPEFITDDLMTSQYEWSVSVMRCGQADPIDFFVNGPVKGSGLLDLAYIGDGRLYDGKTWQKKRPPEGRKYHPDLARFAVDGRFVPAESDDVNVLIDTVTEKHFPTGDSKYEPLFVGPFSNVPGFGSVAIAKKYGSNLRGFYEEINGLDIRLIPASNLDFPTTLLQLWAQVAVRGELGDEGQFVKWDETTWEKKRQELAAMPRPYPDFPVPGHVATDKLHWLRQEYDIASDGEKPRLARQLLSRADEAGDQAEAVRWRAVLAPQGSVPEPASP